VADHVGHPQSSGRAWSADRHRRAADRDGRNTVGAILFFVGAIITHLRARYYSFDSFGLAIVFLLVAVTTLVLGLDARGSGASALLAQ
jgi:hypothetical protein